ncbi:MAG: hypothetical protein N2749_00810 [Clostridia bacterium]|nr:hypothetical protein [Clostridia bacterium]
MAQTINTGYKSQITSSALNDKVNVLLGQANGVLKGFNIVAGSNKNLSLVKSQDTVNSLIIKGAIITEDQDLNNIITIPDNTSGSTKTYTVYAKYEHGVDSACTYGVIEGDVPSNIYCKLGEVIVPYGFSSSSQCQIKNVEKALSMIKNQVETPAKIIRNMVPSGFTSLSSIDYTYMSSKPNVIKLSGESVAYVNGYRITIPADEIQLSAPPSSGSRIDLVFLEVWLDKFTGLPNYKVRVVENASVLTSVNARGQLTNESTTKFAKSSTDNGLYTATVTEASVDNIVYAIPMFTVTRRNSGGYKVNNINGALLYNDRAVGYTFQRESIAYLSDGTKVGNYVPRIENGALLIEEGTTNLIGKYSNTFDANQTVFYPQGLALGKTWADCWDSLENAYRGGYIVWTYQIMSKSLDLGNTLSQDTEFTLTWEQKGYLWSVIFEYSSDGNTWTAWNKDTDYTITKFHNCSLDYWEKTALPHFKVDGFNLSSSNPITYWKRIGFTLKVPSGTRYIRFYFDWWAASSNYSAGGRVRNIQLEQKPYPTSFVDGTRASDGFIALSDLQTRNYLGETSDWTIEVSVKKNTADANSRSYKIFSCAESSGFCIESSCSPLRVAFNDNGACKYIPFATNYPLDDLQWHKIAVVHSYKTKTVSLYLDGVFQNSLNITKLYYNPQYKYPLFIGSENNNGSINYISNVLNGLISDFHISSIARSNSEIQQRAINGFTVDQYTTYSLKPQGSLLLPTSGNLSYPKSVDTNNKKITFYVPNNHLSKIDNKFTVFKNSKGSVAKIESITNNDVLTSVPELTTNNMDYDFYQFNNKRADIIEETDIKDLRNTVSLTGFDYKSMAENQFKEVIIGGQRITIKEYIGRWKQFGVTGTPKSDNTGLNNPFGVAIDSNGYIYVAEFYNHRLVKLNPDLTYNSQFGVTGTPKSDNTGFNYPAGITIDSNGYIYVADRANHRLVKLNPNLTYNSQFGITGVAKSDNTGLNNPNAAAVDSNGYIYVVDIGNHRLVKLNPNLTYNSQFGITGVVKSDNTGFKIPTSVAVDSNGYIYVADHGNHRLVKLNPNLTYNSQFGITGTPKSDNTGLSYPVGVAVDSNGYIYVLQRHKLMKLNPDLTYNSELFNTKVKFGLTLGSTDLYVAIQIAVKGNDFYIPDRYNHRLIKITNMPDDVWYDYNTTFPTAFLGDQDCDGLKTSFSDAPYFNYNTVSVPTSDTIPSYVTRTIAGNNWASGNTIKIKASRSKDKIMGILDPNSAKAKILSINGTAVYLNNVNGIAVNDTVSYFAPDLTLGGTATISAVDTTNKTVTLNVSLSSTYLNGYIFETTVGSSLPLVQFFNSSTKTWTTVNGTWTNLGTNEATFTLGTNASLTNQDIKISYNIVSAGGEGLVFTPREFIGCESDGESLWKQFGITGTPKSDNTGFNYPFRTAVDSNGYIYVADNGNHRLVKLNPDLTYNSQFGVTGTPKSDNTGLNCPTGITIDSNGYIYVADRANHRLVKLNPDLTYNSQFGITGVAKTDNTGLNNPTAAAVDSNGYIYVTDHLNHRLVKLNPDLTYNSQFGVTGTPKSDNTGLSYPVGVAVDSNGYIYVTEYYNHRLVKIHSNYVAITDLSRKTVSSLAPVNPYLLWEEAKFSNIPCRICVDKNGYIYVPEGDGHRLVKLNPNMSYNSQFGTTGVAKTDNTGLNNPFGAAIDSNGYIYVADRANHRLVKLNPNLTYNSQFGITGVAKTDSTGLNNPTAAAVDSNGYIYVTDHLNHRLVKLNPDLTYNSQFGVTGTPKSDNTGFNAPRGVAIDSNGYIYVVDQDNSRLVKLNPELTYNSQFGITGVAKSDNTGFKNPTSVAVDSNGYIYVTDHLNHRLVKLNPDLTYNSQFGVTGTPKSDNTGLNCPEGVTVDSNGYIYISDQNNRVVKIHPNYLRNPDFSKIAGLNKLKPNVAIIYKADILYPADFSTGTYDIVWKSDRVYYTANGSYDSYTSTFRNIANKVLEVAGLENVNEVYPFELSQAQLNLKLPTNLYRAFIEDYNLENMSTITVENALSVLVNKSLGETIPFMGLLPMIIKKDGQLYLLVKGMLTKSSSMNFTSNFQLIVPIKRNPLVK